MIDGVVADAVMLFASRVLFVVYTAMHDRNVAQQGIHETIDG